MVLESLLERAVSKRTTKSQSRRELLDHLDFTEKQLQLVTVEMKDKICKMVEEVEHKVNIIIVVIFETPPVFRCSTLASYFCNTGSFDPFR